MGVVGQYLDDFPFPQPLLHTAPEGATAASPKPAWGVNGKLVSDAVEDVGGWRVVKEVLIPASNGKATYYGEPVALVRTLEHAKLAAAAPALLAACQMAFERSIERSESGVKWTQRDQNAHEALRAALMSCTGAPT